jgi:hypothetical protein
MAVAAAGAKLNGNLDHLHAAATRPALFLGWTLLLLHPAALRAPAVLLAPLLLSQAPQAMLLEKAQPHCQHHSS